MALLRKYFDIAQTFYVDPTTVNGARTCDISAIELYFKHKPDLNYSIMNIPDPAVEIFIAETIYGVPRITRESGLFTGRIASVYSTRIRTSSDATASTLFDFGIPVTVETDKEYAFIIMYGQSSQFELWKSVQGEILTGTNSVSPGPSNKFIGKYFTAVNAFVAEDDTNLDEYLKNWRPKTDTCLKFNIHVARYAHGGVPVLANGSIDPATVIRTFPDSNVVYTANGGNFDANFGSYEYISFNENKSYKAAFVGGMMAYQNTVFHPGGYANGSSTISITTELGNNFITANSTYPNGFAFSWNTLFATSNKYNRIVLTDGTTTNIRQVVSVISNTQLQLNEGVTFANTDAKFMVTATGRISSFNRDSPFGVKESFVMIGNTSANSTVRFVNNDIEAVAVTAGGTGYDNSDIFYVKGFEFISGVVEGGYIAVGNVVTNTSGGIDTIYLSNLGAGFVNSNAMEAVIANSTNVGNTTGNTSAGSGATFSYVIGSTLKTEYGNNNFLECKIRNLDIGDFIPYQQIEVPPGTNYQLKLETNYYRINSNTTYDGFAYYVNENSSNNQLNITMYEQNSTEFLERTPLLPSKSNEFLLKYANGEVNDKISNSASDSSQSLKLVTTIDSNSDFSTVRLRRPSVHFSKYIINNDATNEHTDSGNAYAKGLTNIIPFTRTAEDIRVYLTAYKPSNTDIKVYARIYKNEDPEAFDDKNWTELELKDGTNIISSSADPLNYIELTYGFYQIPQNRTVLDGVVTVASGDANVVGVGTTFDNDLTAGDVVYMYQPLFPENHLIVAVETVTDNTNFTMDFSTTNTSILAEGMKIEKLTYPQQAFNNKQNANMVRYYNSTSSKFDGYDSFAVKIVFLSNSPHKIPRVDDLKVVGVSA
jgi:hypothetical protein